MVRGRAARVELGAVRSRTASGAIGRVGGRLSAVAGSGFRLGRTGSRTQGRRTRTVGRLVTRVRRAARLWWMVEPPARVYRSEYRTLRDAWRRCRDGLAKRPVPKRRAEGFGLSNQDVTFDGRGVRVPKLGWIRTAERVRWRGRVKTVRVTRDADAWHLSVNRIHLPGRHEPEMSLEAALSEARRGLV